MQKKVVISIFIILFTFIGNVSATLNLDIDYNGKLDQGVKNMGY